MFEKEAEEYTKKNFCGCCSLTWKSQCKNFVNCGYHDSWKDGAEFGYNKAFVEADKNLKAVVADFNKANEWHYVKDGDLPNTETKDYTYIRRRKRYERQFTDYRVIKCYVLCQNEKGKITADVGYFDCNKKYFLDKAEGTVYAWKEIVLPELKESDQ